MKVSDASSILTVVKVDVIVLVIVEVNVSAVLVADVKPAEEAVSM